MSCTNCGQDTAGLRPEQDFYGADGALHALPRAFCPACGWPLATAQVSLWPRGELELSGSQPAELRVVLSNDGEGALYYSVDADPRLRPLALPMLHGSVPPGTRREVGFTVGREQVPGAREELAVTVHTLTRVPEVLGEPRRVPLGELWVAQPLNVTVTTLQAGPLAADREHVLFGLGIDEVYVDLLNYGGLPLEAELSCSQGYLACGAAGAGFSAASRVSLLPSRSQDPQRPRPGVTPIRVRAPEDPLLPPGQLTVRAPGLPPVVVKLERVTPAAPPPPEYRYAVGIDFGTSKTAVAWVDQYALNPRPTILEWDRLDAGADRRWLPSAAFYDRQYGVPTFGDQAFAEAGLTGAEVGVRRRGGRVSNDRGTLFVGMKMFLRDADAPEGPPLMQVAADFFRHVFEAIEAKAGFALGKARLVLSLPVLRDAATYQRQQDRTREAALAAGAAFGLKPDQITFEKEPVCAAIDVVRAQPKTNGLQHGDWLCVFDCGAGTTDISLLQVSQQAGAWSFGQVDPLGYEWGGDDLDVMLYETLLSLWANPDDPASIPASGPVTIKPAANPRQAAAIDADAPRRAASTEVDWFAVLKQAHVFKFNGASQAVSRAELLGLASRFKEQYLGGPAPEGERITSETPLRPLSPSKRGTAGPWATVSLDELVRRVSLEFLEMRDEAAAAQETGAAEPLRVRLPRLFRELGLRKPQWVCPVGGTTLIRGWREAVAREPLGLTAILAGEPAQRRLHVARGAAQKELFRVEDRLPEPATLQVAAYQPGEEPRPLASELLPAGSPPGERQAVEALADLPLRPGSRLLFRALLGERVVLQAPLSWFEGAEVVARAGAGPQPLIRVQARLAYLRDPLRLALSATWVAEGDPPAVPTAEVKLPRFEV